MKHFDVDSSRLYLYDISVERLAATRRSAIDDGLGHVVSAFGMKRRCHSALKRTVRLRHVSLPLLRQQVLTSVKQWEQGAVEASGAQ